MSIPYDSAREDAIYEHRHDAEMSLTRCLGCREVEPREMHDITEDEALALDVSGPGILCARCHRLAGNTAASKRLDALAEQIGGVWSVDTEKRPAEVLLHVDGKAVFRATGEDLGAMAESIARDLAGSVLDNQPPPGFVGRLTLMVGASGSGKTTIARSWRGDEKSGEPHILSADDFFVDPETREYHFDIARLGEAHAACLRAAVEALTRGVGFVVIDNTNGSIAEAAPYVALGMAYGYEVEIVRVRCVVEVAAARNVHGVPPSIVRQIAEGIDAMFAAGLPPFWRVTVRGGQA